MYPEYSQSNGAMGVCPTLCSMSRASTRTVTADIGNDFGFKVQTFIEPAPYVNYATTERSNFPPKLVSWRNCSSMLVFGEPMRWVTCIAAPILLADVGDHCFGVFSLDLKRGDERIFGVHGDVVRLPFQFKPDGELHPHASSSH